LFDKNKTLTPKYTFNDLIQHINQPQDFKLYSSFALAKEKSNVITKVEPGTIPNDLADVARAHPYRTGGELLTGKLHGPTTRQYQSLILKIFIFDEGICSEHNDDDGDYVTLSVRSRIAFPHYRKDDELKYSKMSADNNIYLEAIFFKGNKLIPRGDYPQSYYDFLKSTSSPHSGVYSLIKDYAPPGLGLIMSGHWNRHHLSLAAQLAEQIYNYPADTLQHLVAARKKAVEKSAGSYCSFLARIDCALDFMLPSVQRVHEYSYAQVRP
jgi:hypothetical protein